MEKVSLPLSFFFIFIHHSGVVVFHVVVDMDGMDGWVDVVVVGGEEVEVMDVEDTDSDSDSDDVYWAGGDDGGDGGGGGGGGEPMSPYGLCV